MSPFKALYGHDPLHILKGSTIPSCLEEVNKLTIARNELLATLGENLLKSQDIMRLPIESKIKRTITDQ